MEVANNTPNTTPTPTNTAPATNQAAGPVNPLTDAGMPSNQMANQGVPPEKANPLTQAPGFEKPETPKPSAAKPASAGIATAKSELLDAGKILSETLGLQTGQMIADLGAGGGMFTIQAARIVGEQGQVYAVDIIRNTLSDIESKARMSGLYNIKTIWSNLEVVGATQIPEASLDCALLVNVLFQSTKHQEVLTEANRLLKQGGKLLIIDWSDTKPGFAPQSSQQVSPETLTNTARQLNFALDQQFEAGQYHFGLLFTKQ